MHFHCRKQGHRKEKRPLISSKPDAVVDLDTLANSVADLALQTNNSIPMEMDPEDKHTTHDSITLASTEAIKCDLSALPELSPSERHYELDQFVPSNDLPPNKRALSAAASIYGGSGEVQRMKKKKEAAASAGVFIFHMPPNKKLKDLNR